ncbi:MAG: hypothetical protein KC621_04115 [Myxococcales bacterium]|nr:hypothetical protein [Myxococcales bacterium]
MSDEDLEGRVRTLERVNRVLERKLERALDNLERLEDQKEANSRFLHSVIAQMQAKEEELLRKNEALVEATSAKSIFLANMSHELRTPLNAVIGYTELLLDEPEVEAMAGDDLDAILRASRGLLRLIDDILDLTKIESGRLELERRPFCFGMLVRDLSDTIEPLARSKGLTLVIDGHDLPSPLVGDEVRLRQILTNLLSNAVKFTAHGSVTLKYRLVGQTLHVAVSDSGIGMTQRELSRVFDPFVQADTSTTRRFGGTGLGLSIARRLMDLMGGEIVATSVPSRGTVFELHIPAELSEEASCDSVLALRRALG